MATSLERVGDFHADIPTPEPARTLQEATGRDQRAHRRYPIQLDAEFELLKSRVKIAGYARTIDISTGGVLFLTDDSLPTGGSIKLAINWPFLLEGACLLKLVVQGYIVRNDGKLVAIETTRHEFRTAGKRRSTSGPSANNRHFDAAAGAD